MPQISYRAYVAIQLWCFMPTMWFGMWHWLSVLGLALCYAALWWNWYTVLVWLQPRDERGRFMRGNRVYTN